MSRHRKFFWILFWGGITIRCVYIWTDVVDLVPDEAYYWEWSRRLDWCYYSKGPMVAYLIWLGTHLFGPTPFGVRFPTVVLSGLTLWISLKLYERLFPNAENGIVWIGIFYSTIPIFWVGGMLATIDPPLCLAWVLTLYALHRAVKDHDRSAWILLAFALGLGILSKYTMLLIIPTLVMYLGGSAENRRGLKRPEFYLSLSGGLLFLLPLLIWNANHQWISFRHTAAIGQIGQPTPILKNLLNFPTMILTQAGIISPIWFCLLAYAMGKQFQKSWGPNKNDSSLFLTSAVVPLLVFYTLLSLKRSILPNWLVAIYPPAILGGAQIWSKAWREGRCRKWLISGVGLGAILCFFLMFNDLTHRLALPYSEQWDIAARLKGWKEMAVAAEKAAVDLPKVSPFFYFGNRYQTSAELAFYVPGQPWTTCASPAPLTNQYDLWGGSQTQIGWNAIYADQSKKVETLQIPMYVEAAFERIDLAETQAIQRYGKSIGWYKIWRCYRFKDWPTNTELVR